GNMSLELAIVPANHTIIMGDYFLEDGSLNLRTLAGVLILCTLMSFCFGFMVHAFIGIFSYLRNATIMSDKTIRLQRQLFVTLCLQTVIPLVCIYSPCCIGIILPLLGVKLHLISRITPLFNSAFLPLDSLAVLISM
ncbi:hypothetical protein PMAYCL1PPCAC_14831, partial [Pristionchus mayeri]